MSQSFFILLGVSVVLVIVGIAAASVHADMLYKKGGSKGDVPAAAANTAATVTILGLILVMFLWPMSPQWYKAKPMDSVYKTMAGMGIFKPTPMPGVKTKDQEKIYHPIRILVISIFYSLFWGIASSQAAKSTTAKQSSGGGGGPVGKQPRSPWSNKAY